MPGFGPDDIADITRLRGLLEGEAVRMILASGLIPRGAIEAVEVMRRAETLDERPALVAADQGFHRAIVEACGSPRIERSYGIPEGEIELLFGHRQTYYRTVGEMADKHEYLLKSLRSRHYETARAAFLEHWGDLQTKLLGQEAATLRR